MQRGGEAGRLTMAAAARAIGVDKATVSRWVKKHPALLGDDGYVSVEDLIRHRDAVIDPRFQTRSRTAGAVAAPPADSALRRDDTLNENRTRYEAARARQAELDLAARLGQTLDRAQVEAAIAEAAETMKQAAVQLARDRAGRLLRAETEREMERALDAVLRELLVRAADALSAAAVASLPASAEAAA